MTRQFLLFTQQKLGLFNAPPPGAYSNQKNKKGIAMNAEMLLLTS
jgi:hypothetical protein